jgi:hypothetical protein
MFEEIVWNLESERVSASRLEAKLPAENASSAG